MGALVEKARIARAAPHEFKRQAWAILNCDQLLDLVMTVEAVRWNLSADAKLKHDLTAMTAVSMLKAILADRETEESVVDSSQEASGDEQQSNSPATGEDRSPGEGDSRPDEGD